MFLMLQMIQSSDKTDKYYGYDHRMKVEIVNNNLADFLQRWQRIMANMAPDSCPEAMLTGPFYRKIRDHPDMEWDIRTYDRMPEHHVTLGC